jgi:peptidoglycan/LPS O-acetylase OafA/YrhL
MSYGIYLIHIFVLVAMYDWVTQLSLSTPLTMMLTAIGTFIVSALITRLIALLPKSKYIIG